MSARDGNYEHLSREALGARLKVAEDALTLIGWTVIPLRDDHGERSDAALQMWMTWANMVPGGCPGPMERPDLVRLEPTLAEARRRVRAATLKRLGVDDSGRHSQGEATS